MRTSNIPFEDILRHSKYEKLPQATTNIQKIEQEKENSSTAYSPTNSPKKQRNNQENGCSPRFSHLQDSFEDQTNFSNHHYTNQSFEKRHTGLRDVTHAKRNTHHNSNHRENSLSFDKSRNIDPNEMKLLNQEVIACHSLRKSLNEAQSKIISISKELSKAQHENSMFQSQLKRSEAKIRELIENHSSDQAKITELTFQRNQLHSEISKLEIEQKESTHKEKENAENLKNNIENIEHFIEHKNKKTFKHLKKLNFGLKSLHNIINNGGDPNTGVLCQHLFEKMQHVMNDMLSLLGCNNLDDLEDVQEVNEFEALVKIRETLSQYENENVELKDHILYLDNLLQKEEQKNKELVPQYRESLDRLRARVQNIKEQLKESENKRREERANFFENLHDAENSNKALIEENLELKSINGELTGQIKNYEMLTTKNEDKIEKLVRDYQKLELKMKAMKKEQEKKVCPYCENRKTTGNSTSQKEPRSLSRDCKALDQTFAGGLEIHPRNIPPRSNSVMREKASDPQNIPRMNKFEQKPISTDISLDCIPKSCQTFSVSKRRDFNALNKTFEIKFNQTVKNSENGTYSRLSPQRKFKGDFESHPKYHCSESFNALGKRKQIKKVERDRNYVSSQENRNMNDSDIKGFSQASSFNNDLKDEIISLENEIGEIQKFMANPIDNEDVN